MKKSVLIAFLIAIMICGTVPIFSNSFVSGQAERFSISGYILGSNGNGIEGAMIIFGVPTLVPSVVSDNSGRYTISAPAGIYHLTVWPPFDSNYVWYDEPSFVVGSNVAKDITLQSGYKVSGYITDPSGNPVKQAIVRLGNYFTGYPSNNSGYYFVTAPAGTYRFSVEPRIGYEFPSYFESSLVVNGNVAKNVTLSGPATTPILNLQMHPRLDGKAFFTNEKIHNSPKSVKLIVPENATRDSFAMALYPCDRTLNSIWAFSIFTSYTQTTPRFMLCLDTQGRGWADTFLLSQPQSESNGVWKTVSAVNSWTKTNIQLTDYGATWKSLESWLSEYGNTTVRFIGILVDYATINPEGLGKPLYVDELVLNGATYKIAPYDAGTPTPTPMPTPTAPSGTNPSPTPKPTTAPTLKPSPTANLPSTLISISANSASSQIGSTVLINGRLTDRNGIPLKDKTVILSCSVGDSPSLSPIGSGKTNAAGEYNIQWVIAASGSFTLKTEWSGDTNYQGVANSTTLSYLPSQDRNVFCVESNSTVTDLAFNSSSLALGFTVEGPAGTRGYTKASVAKTLAPDFTGITVWLDGKELDFTVTSAEDYWNIEFSYSHSTHQVTVNLSGDSNAEAPIPEFSVWLALAAVLVSTIVAAICVRKKRTRPTGN